MLITSQRKFQKRLAFSINLIKPIYLPSAYIVYFVYHSDCTAFKLLPNFMGVIYQRKPSTTLTSKEGTKNNYTQSLHSPFRTTFQSIEIFKD